MSFDAGRLYSLLPAIYRLRDAEQGNPLRALLTVMAGQAQILEEDIAQLYDDQFIETCAPWVIPYIGDLIGVRALGASIANAVVPRAEVANTIGYRRRKGTLAILEQLAGDVTGWPAHAVEYFQSLATTQSMNHVRPQNPAFLSLRHADALERAGSAFDTAPRHADVRHIGSHRGRSNIPNIGIFLWRLESFPATALPAVSVDSQRWRANPLGIDIQMFVRPETAVVEEALSAAANLPEPLTRGLMSRHLDDYYGVGKSILLNVDGKDVVAGAGQTASDVVAVCDLSDFGSGWAHRPAKIAIDPESGRVAFPAGQTPQTLHVTFHYGFSSRIGSGEYDRAATFVQQLTPVKFLQSPGKIQDSLNALVSGGRLEISDNETYAETPSLSAGANHFEVRAANNRRPLIRLAGDFHISGTDSGEVTLNGLLITGGSVRISGQLRRVRIAHCTLVSGGVAPGVILESGETLLEIDHSIIGGLRAAATATITITASIVDAGSEDGVALAATDNSSASGKVRIDDSTVIGKVHSVELEAVSNAILLARLAASDPWAAPVISERRQEGCIRFSFVPFESLTPRRYRCQPVSAEDAARVRPQFKSLRFGDASYCQLSLQTATEILAGADDSNEMGAFHDLLQSARVARLRSRIDEYLRFGSRSGNILCDINLIPFRRTLMKGDFSRSTFRPEKHYSRVLMQQGRVQVDADWNEQQAIANRRIEIEGVDVIGTFAVPQAAGGFQITSPDGKSLLIGAGRAYLNGILIENESNVTLDKQPDFPNAPDPFKLLSGANTTTAIAYLDVWHRHITALDDPLIREVALNGPDTATRLKTVWQVKVLPVAAPATGFDCRTALPEWDALTQASTASLNARTVPTQSTDNPCLIPPEAGYQRLENQLYRVEIHQPGPLGTATFVWSRDNGSVVTSVEKVSGNDVTVHDVGPDDVLGFANGQTIELIDDLSELSQLSGQLLTIDTVNSGTRVITLKSPPAAVDLTRHPLLRRWDSAGEMKVEIPAINGGWIPLEGGIEVHFAAGTFRTGDYWLIPARTATGEVEWPPFQIPNVNPLPQPPAGVRHAFGRLAVLRLTTTQTWNIQDCRKLFPPLAPPEAMHVMATSWTNDDVFGAFFSDGISVTFDAPVNPQSLNTSTMIVSLEALIPAPNTAGGGAVLPFELPLILDGTIDFPTPSTAHWRPAANLLNSLGTSFRLPGRVRVTLKGRDIWSDQTGGRMYLDGQTFGLPGVRTTNTPRIALGFPSGDGKRASDFESWFVAGPVPLQVAGITFFAVVAGAVDRPSSAGVIKPPIGANQVVQFAATETMNQIEIAFTRPINVATVQAGVLLALITATGIGNIVGDIQARSDSIVRFVPRGATAPFVFPRGNFRLTILGTIQATDGTALGQDLLIPFTVI